jgi:hypothetical protein
MGSAKVPTGLSCAGLFKCRPLAPPISADGPPVEVITLPLLAPPLAPCIDQNSHRHSVPTICLWPEWRPPVSDQAASTHSSSSRFVVSAKIPLQDLLGECQPTD